MIFGLDVKERIISHRRGRVPKIPAIDSGAKNWYILSISEISQSLFNRNCGESAGAVAQLGERLVRNEEVVGSIPISSTHPMLPAQWFGTDFVRVHYFSLCG